MHLSNLEFLQKDAAKLYDFKNIYLIYIEVLQIAQPLINCWQQK